MRTFVITMLVVTVITILYMCSDRFLTIEEMVLGLVLISIDGIAMDYIKL